MKRRARGALIALAAAALGAAALTLAANLYVVWGAAAFRAEDAFALPQAEVIIVPGAAVYQSGELTSAYRARADTARALYASGAAPKVLITGDGARGGHDEVSPARDYLAAGGVAPEDMLLDYEGVNTYESMRRAQGEFGVSSAIVVTQPFHLSRAVFLARHFGIDAYGVETAEWTGGARDTAREWLARVKAVLDIRF